MNNPERKYAKHARKYALLIYLNNCTMRRFEFASKEERDDSFERLISANWDGVYANRNTIINLRNVLLITKGDTSE